MVDRNLFGAYPGAYFVENAVWHAATAYLVFAFFRRLLGQYWLALFVAAVFALHPVNVEVVAWASQRKSLLSAFFWFLSMIVYLDFVEKPSKRNQFFLCTTYLLGLMAKPAGVSLPLVLLILDIWPLQRIELPVKFAGDRGGDSRTELTIWQACLEKLPLVALAGLGYFEWSARSDREPTKKTSIAIASESTIEENHSARIGVPASEPVLPPANKLEGRPNLDRAMPPATPAVQRQKLVPNYPAPSSATAGDGVQELLLARHFLDGKGGTRDTAEAVKWLWKAVGKQNTGAVILLADLYLIGDGVPKNCDQARLLLVAAAKRGASDAAQKLLSLESNGCS